MTKTARILALFAAFAAAVAFAAAAIAYPGDGGGTSPLDTGQCTWRNIGATLDSGPGWRYTCGGDGWVYYNGSRLNWD